MFTRLAPADTGIRVENAYDDPRMWGELYHEFDLGAIGTGIAIGDYDGDGRPDILVVTKTGGCRLFRNLGHYHFEDVTARAGVGGEPGTWNQGATFVDLNNSGRLDIYVCRYDAPNLLYINQGDGTFKEEAHAYGLDLRDASGMAAFCDYDRDGWLDVFVQTNLLHYGEHPNGQANHLFHNNRNGTFTEVTARAGDHRARPTALGHLVDLDNDGWPDLYVANDFAAPDVLYHNNRDGTFTNVHQPGGPAHAVLVDGFRLGDVRNTGRLDSWQPTWPRPPTSRTSAAWPTRAAGHSRTTPIPARRPSTSATPSTSTTGTGRCWRRRSWPGSRPPTGPWSPRLEDLDNDGHLDLFVTNGMHREQTNLDLLARQSLAENTRPSASGSCTTARSSRRTHLAFRNLGDLRFEDVGAAWGLNQRRRLVRERRRRPERPTATSTSSTSITRAALTLLRNDNASGHRVNVDLRGTVSNATGWERPSGWRAPSASSSARSSLARGYLSSSEPMLHFGLGRDTVIARMTVTWPSGIVQTFTDLPADRRYTVTEPAAGTPAPEPAPPPDRIHRGGPGRRPRLFLPGGHGRRGRRGAAPAAPPEPAADPPSQWATWGAAARTRWLSAARPCRPLQILAPLAGGAYAAAATAAASVNDGPVLLFDATGNGREDLLVTRGGNALPAGSPEYQPRLFLNDGHGGLSAAPAGTLPPLPSASGPSRPLISTIRATRALPRLPPASGAVPRGAPERPSRQPGREVEDVTDTLAPASGGWGW